MPGSKRFVCELCSEKPEGYTTRGSLNAHMTAKHGAAKLKCEVCNKEYADKTNLNRHKRQSHKGEQAHFWCITHGKDFGARKDNARRHKTTFSEKGILCDVQEVQVEPANPARIARAHSPTPPAQVAVASSASASSALSSSPLPTWNVENDSIFVAPAAAAQQPADVPIAQSVAATADGANGVLQDNLWSGQTYEAGYPDSTGEAMVPPFPELEGYQPYEAMDAFLQDLGEHQFNDATQMEERHFQGLIDPSLGLEEQLPAVEAAIAAIPTPAPGVDQQKDSDSFIDPAMDEWLDMQYLGWSRWETEV